MGSWPWWSHVGDVGGRTARCASSRPLKVRHAPTFSASCSAVLAPNTTLARCGCWNAYANATWAGGTSHASASATTRVGELLAALHHGRVVVGRATRLAARVLAGERAAREHVAGDEPDAALERPHHLGVGGRRVVGEAGRHLCRARPGDAVALADVERCRDAVPLSTSPCPTPGRGPIRSRPATCSTSTSIGRCAGGWIA